MALFLSLYLGHILGDFVFQPGRLVVAKRRKQWAVLLHTAIVTGCTAIASAGILPDIWLAVLLAGVAHFGVEQLTIRARRLPGASGLTVFVFDQLLHLVLLASIAIAVRLDLEPVIGAWPVSLSWLAMVCGVATVAFAGSILVFEAQMSRVALTDGPDPILGLDGSRLYGMTERAGALIAAFALPLLPALGVLVFLPRFIYAITSPAERRARQLTAAGVGLLLCVVTWALVATISSTL